MEHVEKVALKLGLGQFVHLAWVKNASATAKVPPIIVVFGAFVVSVLAVLIFDFPRIIFETIFLFLYPAYKSLKALQTEESYDDRRWLTYWIIFGLLFGFDSSLGFLLNRIPFWTFLRIAFLVWVMIPGTHGAETVYEKVISPIFQKYSEQIDGALNTGEAKFKELAKKAKDQAAQTIANNLLKTSGN